MGAVEKSLSSHFVAAAGNIRRPHESVLRYHSSAALLGYVFCRADVRGGSIRGRAADEVGHAMRANARQRAGGAIVSKALRASAGSTVKSGKEYIQHERSTGEIGHANLYATTAAMVKPISYSDSGYSPDPDW